MRIQSSRIFLLFMLILMLTLYPIGMAQGNPDPGTATLRLSLPAGTVVGSNPDPWLSEGWLLNLTGNSWSFIVNVTEISTSHKSYDTHLIVALNDLAYNNLLSLVINGTAIPKAAFQNGIPEPYRLGWVWPNDVYPTWYNDTYINLGTLNAWESKILNVSVTFSDSAGARMHFDAYGKAIPGQINKRGNLIHNPNSADATVVSAGAPSGIPPHAEFTYSPSDPIVSENVTFNASGSYDPDGYIVSYTWSFGDGNVTVSSNPIVNHHYVTYGNYSVTLEVKDNDTLTDYAVAIVNVGEYPVANFTFTPATPMANETVTFNASSSTPNGGVIVNYTWNFDDSNITIVNTPIITHIYTGIDKYNVTLTVIDSEGLSDTTWNRVKVVTQPTSPVPNFTWSPPNPTVNETISFDASSSQPGFDGFNVCPISWYYWNFGDGNWANETDPITTHAYTSPGTYYVNLIVYAPPSPDDPDYDPSNNTTIPITITTGPHAEFTYSPSTPYTEENVTFNATLSYDPDGTIVSYLWDFGDNTTGTGNITTHSYTDDGTYTVTLNVTDNDGLNNTASDNITVLNQPPVAAFTENATTVLTGEAIHFNASGSNDPDGSIATYYWNFGDGNNAWGIAVEHSYVDDGTYTVNLTVTDDDGATASVTTNKTVLNRPPVAFFTENATIVLVGEPIHFDASGSSDPDGTIVTYFWDFGDGNNGTGVSVDHSYSTAGNYTVTLTVTDDDGATDSANANKTVLEIELAYYLTVGPDPTGVITIPGEGWYANDTDAILTASTPVSVSPGIQYRFDYWDVDEVSQGSGVNPITVHIDTNHTATAHYVLQHYLTVISPYGTPSGEDWYDNSTYAYAILDTGIVDHGNGTRRVFTHWSGDASGTNYIQSDSIHMDGPKTATANWKTQYLVTFAHTELDNAANSTVVTVNGAPKNFSVLPFEMWADNGSSVTYSYNTLVSSTVSGKRFRLDSISSPPSPFTVTGPVTITGNYQTQYYLTMITNFGAVAPSSGWHDAGSAVQINASAPSVVDGEQYVWLGWTGTGSGSYSSTDNPASITMNGPITETAAWRHEYYLTVTSPYGSPTPTSGWFEAGDSITASVTSPWSGPAGTRYVCIGWIGTGSVPASGATATIPFTINMPSNITWNWKTQYYLTVKTAPVGVATIPGGGWYDSSENVVLTAPTVVSYNFINWDVDGVSQGSGVNPITVHMDGSHMATAHYQAVGQPVGGYATPIDKPQLMYPWMNPASALAVAILLTVFLVRYMKRNRERTLTVR